VGRPSQRAEERAKVPFFTPRARAGALSSLIRCARASRDGRVEGDVRLHAVDPVRLLLRQQRGLYARKVDVLPGGLQNEWKARWSEQAQALAGAISITGYALQPLPVCKQGTDGSCQ
jgi:hypothetical protein